jgi:hypothetical protein
MFNLRDGVDGLATHMSVTQGLATMRKKKFSRNFVSVFQKNVTMSFYIICISAIVSEIEIPCTHCFLKLFFALFIHSWFSQIYSFSHNHPGLPSEMDEDEREDNVTNENVNKNC